jgi:hypothetical protein
MKRNTDGVRMAKVLFTPFLIEQVTIRDLEPQ